jgi:Tol biopolymer transport system component
MKTHFRGLALPVLLYAGCLLPACSKDKKSNVPGGSGSADRIFYSGNTAFKILDLRSGTEKSIINNAAESHQERYDVARDGSQIVFYSESLTSDDITFTIYNADGGVIKTFGVGKYVSGIPKLSPDKSMIAFIWQPASTYPDKYVAVFSRDGRQLRAFKGVDDYAWTSDQRLLMVTSNAFYLSSADLSTAQQLRNLNGLPEEPEQLDISRNDKRVAFVSGSHIWMMNMDGSGLRQVTSSGNREWYPAWSPDDSRIYFNLDWTGNCLELRVIPSDAAEVINIDPHTDGPAPRIMLNGNRICSQSQPMARP